MLLAIDPGCDTGWAIFDGRKKLIACGLGDPRQCHWTDLAKRVFIEVPRIYPGGRTKNPQDVLKVAVKAGEWAGIFGRFAETTYIEPSGWKGQTPKRIQNPRDLSKLTADERALVESEQAKLAASKRHNVLDAIGIGLFGVGR